MKLPKLKYAIALLSAILCVYAYGGRNIDHLDMTSGLSNGYVTSIAQDSNGFIWIATEDGLNCFNGQRFTNFRKGNSELSANEFNCVVQLPDDPGHLWIGTQRDGVCTYDIRKGVFSRIDPDKMFSTAVTAIRPASGGGMWLAHYNDGVQYYNPKTRESRVYNSANIPGFPARAWAVDEGPNGTIYVGHVKNGFSVIDTLSHTVRRFVHTDGKPSIPGDQVYAICVDNSDNVWLGTDRGVALYNPYSREIIPFVHNESDPSSIAAGRVRDIRQLDNGEIWFATSQGGISILDPSYYYSKGFRDAKFTTLPTNGAPNGTSSSFVRSIFEDSFGNIWIGNYRTGIDVMKHYKAPLTRLDYFSTGENSLDYLPSWSCDKDAQGAIWIGGADEIVRFLKGEMTRFPLPRNGKGSTFVKALRIDGNGKIWIGTYDLSAMVFDPAAGSFTPVTGLPLDVRIFLPDKSGNMLIGADGGVYICPAGSTAARRLDNVSESLGDLVVQSMVYDRKGNLWVGTFGNGITVFDRSMRPVKHLSTDSGFPSNAINALKCDTHGKIWVASRSGVILITDPSIPDEFRRVDPESLGVTHVKSIEEDNYGNIWASTNLGLVKIDNAGKNVTIYGHAETNQLCSFMEDASVAADDGLLYFASGNGVFCLNPSEMTKKRPEVSTKITGFTVLREGENREDNQIRLPVTEGTVRLPYDQNSFIVTFNVLDYALTSTVDFSYRMEGLDDRWINADGDNDAVYRNLPPGTYRFQVRQRQKGEEWDEAETLLTIKIKPPFWLSWWAKLIYIVAGAAAIVGIARFYKNRVKLKQRLITIEETSRNRHKLNEERLRFYTNVTHELRTPLTLILGPVEDLLSDPSLPSEFSNRLRLIRDNSASLQNLINEILEFRKTETQNRQLCVVQGNITNLLRELGLRFKELNHNPDVTIGLDLEDIPDIYFDREMITVIVNNLMSNAVKYTSKGSIVLSCRNIEEKGIKYTEIRVKDTGFGIPQKNLGRIFDRYYQVNGAHQASGTGIGLALVKNLVELHQATIEVLSEEGVGSEFILRLVTDNSYPDALHGSTAERKTAPAPADIHSEERAPNPSSFPEIANVLVVDDNDDICDYISQALSGEFHVETARNGIDALRKMSENIPDIVISDIMMPEMDGITLCRHIKEDIQTSHIPVILLTAKDSLSDKEAGYDAGANSYLTKPFSAKLLLSRIHNIIRRRRKTAERLLNMKPTQNPNPSDEEVREEEEVKEELDRNLSTLDRQFVDKIINVINANIANPDLGVAFLADKMCMSNSTLYRKVMAIMGVSPNEYIRRQRLALARELLLEGKQTITDISYNTGFATHSSFAKAFKKEFGMTATEFTEANARKKTTQTN